MTKTKNPARSFIQRAASTCGRLKHLRAGSKSCQRVPRWPHRTNPVHRKNPAPSPSPATPPPQRFVAPFLRVLSLRTAPQVFTARFFRADPARRQRQSVRMRSELIQKSRCHEIQKMGRANKNQNGIVARRVHESSSKFTATGCAATAKNGSGCGSSGLNRKHQTVFSVPKFPHNLTGQRHFT